MRFQMADDWILADRAVPPYRRVVDVQGRKTQYSQIIADVTEGEAFRGVNYRGEDYWQDASDQHAYWSVTRWR